MPGRDGTGPRGMGPMTGRAAGYCVGSLMPGFTNVVGGRGFCGWGRGRGGGRGGRGWRNRFYSTRLTGWQRAAMGYPAFAGGAPPEAAYAGPFGVAVSGEQQIDALKGQAEYFEDALEGIRKRIEEIEARSKKD